MGLLLLLAGQEATAQSYMMRYANTVSGAITFVGNTLGLAKLSGQNQPGALDAIGTFITLNTNSQVGTYPPGTTLNWSNDSSAAVLVLPANSTVLYAELIWAGSAQIASDTTPAGNVLTNLNTPVTLITPDGTTNVITPDPATMSLATNPGAALFYTCSANVTALVQAEGAGTYVAGGVPGTVLASENANNACGWTLAVVYGNSALHPRNLSLFIGNSFAISGGAAPAPAAVTGFCTPPIGSVHGRLYVSAVEGDPNKTGDQMLFGPATNSLAQLSGSNNLANNFFASQINGDNGLLDTNGTFGLSNSIPGAVSFCARQGWDITSVDVSAGLANGITSAYAQNITVGDGYSVNALALQIDVGSPILATSQTVNKGSTYVGDSLTYTVTITNSGTADAVNPVFTDPLPFGTSFVTNTFTTNGVTVSGADPVNGVALPTIYQGTSFTVTYQAVVNQIPPAAQFVTAAEIDYQYSGECGNSPIINARLVNANVQTLVPLLDVQKTAGLTNVIPGATFTYTINVPNVGTTNTTGTELIDPLPVGVSYVTNTATLNGTNIPDINGTNMPFTVAREIHGPGSPAGEIDMGQMAVVTFQVKISNTPPVRINNTATILADGIAPSTAQNAAVNINPVYCDLAAGINGIPNPVAAGAALSYSISITNHGPDSLNLITNFITLYLPLSSSILSPVYTPSSGVYNPLNGVWSGITLPSNGVVTLNISGTVSPTDTGKKLISLVTVSPPPGVLDIVTNNNTAVTTNTIVQSADLAMSISDGVTNVYQGEPLTYTLTAINLGPSTLTTITVTNAFSTLLTNLSVYPQQGSFNQGNGVWNGLNLAAGGSVTLTATANVRTNITGGLTNTVSGGVPSGVTDPVLTNNSAMDVDYVVLTPDVAVTKTGPATVVAETNFTYTLTATNYGHTTATNVVLSDVLPANVVFVAASGGGTNSSGTVLWNLGNFAVNTGSNVTVTVTAPAGGTLTNVATVTDTNGDYYPGNNQTPPVTTTVTPVADLGIGKSGPATVLAVSNLLYTISVTNFGPSSASGVLVTDTLPLGVTFASATGGGSKVGGVVTWNLGTLVSNQVTNVTVTVTAPASGTLTNVASVGSPTGDPNLTNNVTPPVTTAVIPLADLVIKKAGPAGVLAASNFSYTISVTNLGPSSAAGVLVTDTLPVGVTFLSASGSGSNASGVVTWNLGTMSALQATNLTLTVTAPVISVALTNVASAGSPTGDTNVLNNVTPPVLTTVTPSADVSVFKTGPAGALFGTNYNYTITVSNAGPSMASSVNVTDSLPAGLVFVTSTPLTTTNASSQVIWSLGNLGANTASNLTMTVISTKRGSITNTASAGGPTFDPVPTNNMTPPVVTSVTNNPPVANPDGYVTTENTTNILTPLTNDVVQTPGGVLTIIGVSPTNGAASIVGGTNVSFVPATNFVGTATIGYTITDNVGGTNSSLITVTVTNIPPVANPDSYAVTENTTNTLKPLVNDVVHTSGGSLSIISVNPTNGTANIIGGTNVSFIPAANFLGTATIGYTITDGIGGTNSSLITITVTNIPPAANPDSYLITENTTNTLTPLANDVLRTPGGVLSIVLVNATNGTASIIGGTNVSFIPTTNFLGTATIGYTITDGIGGTNASLITVTVTNLPPVANPDSYALTENTTNTLTPLFNDVLRTPGGTLKIISVSPTNGTASIVGGTNVSFAPTANFLGTATIGYTITDGVGGTNNSLITITVTNMPPVANPDSYSITENTTNTLKPLVNDALNTPGGSLKIIGVSPTNGVASIVGGTNVVFIPATNFLGTATIGYTITDGIGGTNASLITVTVTNIPPVANPDVYSMIEDGTNTLAPLANDLVLTPRGVLSIVSVSPTNGTANIVGGTNIVFIPVNLFIGVATIGYTITDGIGGTNTSLITVTVTNIPPLANPDSYAVTENTTNILAPLVNDVLRTPGGSLNIVSVSPTNGVAIIVGGTNVSFVPATNFLGAATIGYTITDGIGGTNTSLITVTVTNIPPAANPDSYAITENTTNTLTPLVNDVVLTPGGSLSIVSVSPTNGTVSIVGGTNVSFIPTANFLGTATIGYTITDGIGGTNTSLITVTVTNIPPVANPDSYAITENTTNLLTPLVNDMVITSGGTLKIVSVSPTNGTASIVGGTNVSFIPTTNFLGTATIGYTITDGIGGTNTSLITIVVTNIPPVANPDAYSVAENTTNTFVPLSNDILNTPGGNLSIISVSPTNGVASIVGGTNVVFVPATNFLGTATIGYAVTDGIGGTNTSLITIGVTNSPPVANPDGYAITENTTNSFAVLTNDLLITPGGTLTIISVNPTNGTANVNGTNIVFVPATNFLGTASIGYTITDGVGGTNSTLVTVQVTNIPPVANPDGYTVLENSTNTFSPLTNDLVLTPGGTLSLIAVNPTNCTATISGTNVIFTPTPGYTGPATIGYTITDGIGGTNSTVITVSVLAVADLAVSKSGAASVYAATNFDYTITVTNLGPGTAANLSVTDNLPASVTYFSATAGATLTGSQLVWTNLGPLAANAAEVLTVTVTAPANGVTITNFASAGSPTSDPNPTNNTSPPVVTTVTPVADLVIVKTALPVVFALSNLTYTVSVTNLGPSTAGGVLVTDALPSGVTFVNASGNGSNNNGVVTWNFGTLTNNQSSNVTVTVTAPASGTLTNMAKVGSPTLDTNVLNNTTPPVVTIVTTLADLAVGKTGPAAVLATSNLVYTISVTNFGPSSAGGVMVTDALPTGVTFVNATAGGVNNSGTVIWSLGTLTNNQVVGVSLTVTAPTSGTLTNVASAGSPTGDPNLTNNVTPPVTTTVTPVADLRIGKTGLPGVFANSNLTYTISVTNFGPSSASSVTVTDALPVGVGFAGASGSGANNAGVVTWNLGTLISNQVTNVTVTVTAPASGTLTNAASVGSPTGDPNLTNNVSPPVITTVTPLADLAIGKTGPASVLAVSNFSYTVSVTNFGPSSAAGVLVTDTLPAGVIFVSASGNGAHVGGNVIWNLGGMTALQATNLTLTVTAPATGVTLTNVASVGSPTGDPEPTNNLTPPVITGVTPVADVSVVKSGPAGALFGTNYNYTITVSNAGPSAAASVSVTDSLPAGLVFVTSTPLTATNAGNQVIWNLPSLNAHTASNLTLTVNATLLGSLTNFASVGGPTLDPVPTNNLTPPVVTTVTNNPPLANPDLQVMEENTTGTFSPLTNDVVRTPGGGLTLIGVTTTNGTAGLLNSTNVSFTPATNYIGLVTLVYTITDNVGGTNSSTLTILVTNLPPVANPDIYSMAENTASTLTPLVNDVNNTPGGVLAIITVNPTNGMASVVGGTNVAFVPATNFVGTATIGYTITDGIGGTSTSLITISVTNQPPVANPDSYAITENTTNSLPVLVNDVVVTPGGVLSIISVSPTNGTASISGTNIVFVPATNFLGTATIGYKITDGIGGTNATLVTVLVTNIPPLANPDVYSMTENTTNTLKPLLNDLVLTPRGGLSIIAVSPTNGTASIVGGTNVVFVPTTNFLGIATIGYAITDGIGGTNASLITVTVTNIPPVANPDAYSMVENTTNTLTPLANDVLRTPGGVLSIVSVSPTNGTASIVGGTNVSFIPTTNFLGTATIGYMITDGIGGTNTALITISVTNIPPVANPDAYSMVEDGTNTFTPLVNDVVSTPGGVLSIISVNATNGTASIIGGTNVIYTAALNFVGATTIGYTITDNVGGTNSSFITVTVTNQAPVAFPQSLATTENTALPVTLTGGDPLNLPLTFLIVSNAAHGTLTGLNTNTGAVTYTPTNNFMGTDTFVFRVNNGVNNSSNATVSVSVTPIADLLVQQSGPANAVAGSNLVFVVAVTNLGPAGATNVVVTNQIDPGFTFVSASAGGSTNGDLVTWTIPVLRQNGHTNLTVTLFAVEGGTYTNDASGTSDTPDLITTNNDGSLANAQVVTTVSALADVQVFKTGDTNVLATGAVNYAITATNAGPSTAANVVVQDSLPAGATLQTASGDYVLSNNVIVWSAANLVGATATNFTVTLTAPVTGTLTNVAYSTSDTPDGNTNNNNGSSSNSIVKTVVTPQADLAVGKTGAAAVFAESNLVYTISVTNFGPSSASGVVVTDTLPAGVSVVGTTGGGLDNNGVETWNLGTLASNQIATVTLTIAAPAAGVLTNVASVGSPTGDPVPTNNLTPPVITTVIPVADLSVGKAAAAAVFAESNLVYTISVTNFGPSSASSVSVTDALPANATFVSATGGGVDNNGTVTWSLGTLASNQIASVTVTVTTPDSGTLTNVASVGSPIGDPNPTNNVTPPVLTTVTPLADLGIGKTAAATVFAGSNLVYTISVTNFGPSSASSVSVTDTLPARVSLVSTTGGGVNNNGSVTWNLGTLASNQIASVTVTVTAPAAGTLTNVATVGSPTGDPVLTNNITPPVFTTVTPVADLAIGKFGAATVLAESNVVYTISVTNFGPSIASSVMVTDALPAGVAFVSATGGGVNNSGMVTWSINTLVSNQVTNVTVTVTAPASGSLTNTASVGSPTGDPNLTNNVTPPVITTVTPVADLGIGKTASASVFAASNLVYTISVTNFGPSSASGVIVTDTLPASGLFGGTTGGGVNNGGVVTWSLGILASNQVTNVTVTVTAPIAGSLTNVASVGSPTGDPVATNNVTPPVITTVIPLADLAIGKSGPAAGVLVTNFSYTISVTNFGPSVAANFAVTDSLPPGIGFISALPAAKTNAASQVIWTNLGTLAVNGTTNLTLTVKALQRGVVTNIATVGGPTLDPDLTNNVSPPVVTAITNRPPVAVNDFASIPKNVSVTVPVLANDSDPDGDPLTIVSVSPTNGTAVISGTNVVFTPTTAFIGLGTVGYTITDGFGGTNSALVTINVTNRPPVANGQNVSVMYNLPQAITLTGSDPDSDPLTFIIVGNPTNGVLSLINTNTGAVTYTPGTNYIGADAFTFMVNDGTTNSLIATVNLTVAAPVTADLAVFKTGPASGVAGSNLVYTVTVTNLGPGIATNVLVTDQLPIGYTFVSATPANTTVSGNGVNWAAFNLAPHTRTNFTVTAYSAEGGTFTNVAMATADAYDPNLTNNNGTATNSQVRTVVSALADVQVFKTGGTNVGAGSVLNYTITATNAGPSTATNVVVQDNLPAGATFQSASGTYTISNNIVTWAAMVLTSGAAENLTIALTAPLSGSFTNIALATSPTPDPNPTNNNGSMGKSRVVTKIVPLADLIVRMVGPANAVVGSNFVYSIIVSNAGPSTSSNAVASDALPTNLVFVSASAGGTFSNGTVTWPKVLAIPDGGQTNYSITVYSPLVGVFTNVASAVAATLDPNPTNNTGVLPDAQVQTTVTFAQFSWLGGTPVFNPQTGLYEETVLVTNAGTGTVAGFQLYVTVLTPNVYLWNATGTNSSGAYVQYSFPVDPSNSVSLALEFYDPSRVAFTNTLRVVPVIPGAPGNVGTNGSAAVSKIFTDTRTGTPRFVIDFASVPGKVYTIIYSSDLVTWKVATPSVTASANDTQWYDDGPPKTESAPMSVTNRFYRVIQY